MHLQEVYNQLQSLAQFRLNKDSSFNYTAALERLYNILDDHGLADVELPAWATGYNIGNIVHTVRSLPEYVIDGYGHQEKKDKNHFLIEIFRTAETERPTVFNILKIGFYAGLVRSNLKPRDFPEGIVKLFQDFTLYQLNNYIDKATQQGAPPFPDDIMAKIGSP